MTEKPRDLRTIIEALDEFEEAVKKHEHFHLVESEVTQRQNVDRTRQKVLDAVVQLVKARTA